MAEAQSIPPSKQANCSGCGKIIWKSRTSAVVQSCRECRKARPTPYGPRSAHGSAARYSYGCRCDDCKAGVAGAQREYARRRRGQGKPASAYRPALCVTCGEEFNARKRDGGYAQNCSIRCANVARNFARGFSPRPPRKSEFRKRAERAQARALTGTTGGNLVWVQGACIVCTEQFLSRGAMSRYCSMSCRLKNRANRSYGLSWLDRMALFARDGWCCQICSEPTDYTADPTSDWYPTLDHIVPRSHGGSDDVSNLRTAHRWCNSVRGDLSHYTDADLMV